jgi:hypothetical protein
VLCPAGVLRRRALAHVRCGWTCRTSRSSFARLP